jgi:hypothetical protein
MKQTATDAHNCEIEWNADFARMKLTLQHRRAANPPQLPTMM